MQVSELESTIGPAVLAVGCTLEGVEIRQGDRRPEILVYIDKAPDGVSLDDCAAASRQIDAVLAVADTGLEDYRLEVSSPGLDRRLFTIEQMSTRIGMRIRLRLLEAHEKRREFEGKLVAADEACIELEDDTQHRWSFEQQALKWVRLVPVISWVKGDE